MNQLILDSDPQLASFCAATNLSLTPSGSDNTPDCVYHSQQRHIDSLYRASHAVTFQQTSSCLVVKTQIRVWIFLKINQYDFFLSPFNFFYPFIDWINLYFYSLQAEVQTQRSCIFYVFIRKFHKYDYV